jgi:hypothetical protein
VLLAKKLIEHGFELAATDGTARQLPMPDTLQAC